MLPKLKTAVGNAWGKATTIGLAAAVAILSVPFPPELMNDTVRWCLFGAAVCVALARHVAPPPEA